MRGRRVIIDKGHCVVQVRLGIQDIACGVMTLA